MSETQPLTMDQIRDRVARMDHLTPEEIRETMAVMLADLTAAELGRRPTANEGEDSPAGPVFGSRSEPDDDVRVVRAHQGALKIRTVKQPEDHKPKAANPKVTRDGDVTTVTHLGLTLTVDGDAFNDYEVMVALSAVDEGRLDKLDAALRGVFGDAGRATVLEHFRDEKTRRVPLISVVEFFGEVMEAIAPN